MTLPALKAAASSLYREFFAGLPLWRQFLLAAALVLLCIALGLCLLGFLAVEWIRGRES